MARYAMQWFVYEGDWHLCHMCQPCHHDMEGGGGAMARYAMQWFVYEGDWHLCHLFHLCQPCHHDTEGGGGGIGKCAVARAVTWVSSMVLCTCTMCYCYHPLHHHASAWMVRETVDHFARQGGGGLWGR